MRWFVYILKCKNGALYTGISTDITRRIEEHSAGKGSRFVRSHLPVKLVYQKSFATRSLALKREAAIKRLPRKKKLEILT